MPEAALDNWQPVWNAQVSISTPVCVNFELRPGTFFIHANSFIYCEMILWAPWYFKICTAISVFGNYICVCPCGLDFEFGFILRFFASPTIAKTKAHIPQLDNQEPWQYKKRT